MTKARAPSPFFVATPEQMQSCVDGYDRPTAKRNLAMVSWLELGKPTVRLTHSLYAALMMTKCRRLDHDESAPETPYPVLLIQYPENQDGASGIFLFQTHEVYRLPDDEPSALSMWRVPSDRFNPCGVPQQDRARYKRLVNNLMDYIDSIGGLSHDTLTSGPPTKKRPDTKPHHTVGREIKLSAELRALASDGPRENRFRFKSRWLVRGHYRRLASKTIWIQPYWKGPEEGLALRPAYVAS